MLKSIFLGGYIELHLEGMLGKKQQRGFLNSAPQTRKETALDRGQRDCISITHDFDLDS